MKVYQLVIIAALVIISKLTYGQIIGFDNIDDSKVKPWIVQDVKEYQNIYHFGDSEWESTLILLVGEKKTYAQIITNPYNEDLKTWVYDFENLDNVSVEGNKFYSDKTHGEFVVYDNGYKEIKGLKVFNSWSGFTEENEYEIGPKIYSIESFFKGIYPQASTRHLTRTELKILSKPDLQIMRNEIFARYGYIFKEGGEMDKYFKSQEWYTPQHKNVNDFLSEIEKANLKLIREVEAE